MTGPRPDPNRQPARPTASQHTTALSGPDPARCHLDVEDPEDLADEQRACAWRALACRIAGHRLAEEANADDRARGNQGRALQVRAHSMLVGVLTRAVNGLDEFVPESVNALPPGRAARVLVETVRRDPIELYDHAGLPGFVDASLVASAWACKRAAQYGPFDRLPMGAAVSAVANADENPIAWHKALAAQTADRPEIAAGMFAGLMAEMVDSQSIPDRRDLGRSLHGMWKRLGNCKDLDPIPGRVPALHLPAGPLPRVHRPSLPVDAIALLVGAATVEQIADSRGWTHAVTALATACVTVADAHARRHRADPQATAASVLLRYDPLLDPLLDPFEDDPVAS